MKTLYLYAIPETLISLVHTGKMPENSLERTIDLYQNPTQCTQSSPYVVRSTFLIELVLPEENGIDPVNFTFVYENDSPIKIQTQQIRTCWITNIYTYNKAGYNLALRYFNMTENPVPICIKEEYFKRNSNPDPAKTTYAIKAPLPIMPNVRFMKEGDLLGSQAQTLVNTVNCVGVMGKGIAKMFKDRFPLMFADYSAKCKAGEVTIGKPYLFKDTHKWIINFPTKDHWRNPSRLEYIEKGLQYLAQQIKAWEITSIAIPPLGCGNGGLDWHQVKPIILKYLSMTDITVEIYTPFTPQKELSKKRKHEDHPSSQAELTNFFHHSSSESSSAVAQRSSSSKQRKFEM